MRRTFADVLREGKIDIKNEYDKLYTIMYGKISEDEESSLHDIMGERFTSFYFRGTCLTLDEFDQKHGFEFERNPENFDIEYLVSFCEYFQNMISGYRSVSMSGLSLFSAPIDTMLIMEQIRRVVDSIGYMSVSDEGYTIYVEKSPEAIAVSESEILPVDLSYKVLEYNHYALHGKLEKKKQILLSIASVLEANREELKKTDCSLCSDVFYAFNNLNIRHNNIDSGVSKKYKSTVAGMKNEQIEFWYDEVYRMCLLAFMELEQAKRKPQFNHLKDAIEGGYPYEI